MSVLRSLRKVHGKAAQDIALPKMTTVSGSEQGKISPTSHLLAEGKVASWQHRRPQGSNCRHCDAVQAHAAAATAVASLLSWEGQMKQRIRQVGSELPKLRRASRRISCNVRR